MITSENQINNIPLGVRVNWVGRINQGFRDRVKSRFSKSEAMISLVVQGKRNNKNIKEYMNAVSTRILQEYIKNPNITNAEMLKLENT